MIKYMKKGMTAAAVMLLTIALTGCVAVSFGSRGSVGTVRGEGELTSMDYEVGDYDSVEIGGMMKIVYSATPSANIRLDIQENLRQYVSFRVQGTTLVIDCDRNLITPTDKTPVLYLYNPNLKAINASGAVSMKDSDPIEGESFTLDVSGGADIELTLDVNKFETYVSGAGNIVLNGTAQNANIEISGAGNIEALGLDSRTARIRINGAGSASISCSDELDINMSGAGYFKYKGSPSVRQSISGAVRIEQAR